MKKKDMTQKPMMKNHYDESVWNGDTGTMKKTTKMKSMTKKTLMMNECEMEIVGQ